MESCNDQQKEAKVSSVSESQREILSGKKVSLTMTAPKGVLQKPNAANGKLAFSLKQKSRPNLNPLKLADDEEEDNEENDRQPKKPKHERPTSLKGSPTENKSSATEVPVYSAPADSEVKKAADKLASFVAKNGREIENITRKKNLGDPRFQFLFETSSSDYKYYEQRISEELALVETNNPQASQGLASASISEPTVPHSGSVQQSGFQTPASALYAGREGSQADQAKAKADSLAMMEFYMRKAAQEDMRKAPKQSKDEMPPPACLQAQSQKKGHHMGDYIPDDELSKFLAKCNDAHALKQTVEAAEKAKIQADNVGHRLLSKMGWKEGEGLGSGKSGRADPVQAGTVKLNNLGVGAEQPGEVTPEDDIYEQYKKRMMLGYRFRPNPLNNPRKAYY